MKVVGRVEKETGGAAELVEKISLERGSAWQKVSNEPLEKGLGSIKVQLWSPPMLKIMSSQGVLAISCIISWIDARQAFEALPWAGRVAGAECKPSQQQQQRLLFKLKKKNRLLAPCCFLLVSGLLVVLGSCLQLPLCSCK